MYFSFRKDYLNRPPTRRVPERPIILRRQKCRQVPSRYPYFALPLDDADALVGPGHEGAVGVSVGDVLGVVEGGEDFVAEPFGDVAVFGVPEAVEGFVGAGFADDFHFLAEAAEVFQDNGAFLFRIHALGQVVGAAGADQAAEVEADEPGLAVDQDGA